MDETRSQLQELLRGPWQSGVTEVVRVDASLLEATLTIEIRNDLGNGAPDGYELRFAGLRYVQWHCSDAPLLPQPLDEVWSEDPVEQLVESPEGDDWRRVLRGARFARFGEQTDELGYSIVNSGQPRLGWLDTNDGAYAEWLFTGEFELRKA